MSVASLDSSPGWTGRLRSTLLARVRACARSYTVCRPMKPAPSDLVVPIELALHAVRGRQPGRHLGNMLVPRHVAARSTMAVPPQEQLERGLVASGGNRVSRSALRSRLTAVVPAT